MKRLILLLALLLLTTRAVAQLNCSGGTFGCPIPAGVTIHPQSDSTTAILLANAAGTTNVLVIDTTNTQVGIGTTPGATLDVAGGIRNTSGNITLGNTSSNASPAVLFVGTNSQLNWRIRQNDATPGDLNFDPSTAAGGTNFTTSTLQLVSTRVNFNLLGSITNCASSTGTCTSAPAGSVTLTAGATTGTISTTAITANSQVFLQEDPSLGSRLGVTCNTVTGRLYTVTTRTAGTSFILTASAAPAANPACLNYFIIN